MQSQPLTNYRCANLAQLIGITPEQANDYSAAGCVRILNLLRAGLKGERERGKNRHWCYSASRHIALREAFDAEAFAVRRLSPHTILRAEASLYQQAA